MSTTTKLLLGGAVLAAAWYLFGRRTVAPSVVAIPGSGALATLAGLPDPRTVSIGTRSPDGKFVVVQSRQIGSEPHWEPIFTGFGGGVPGMIT